MLFRIDAPKRSRTPNLLIRSQTLYPVELWAHIQFKKIINHLKTKSKIKKIGKTGFEPATPWSQTKYSTKLSYFPLYASGRIRTYNRLIRSQVLYPVEPRLQITFL